ncbi:zinc-binding dehydrogenase [Nakamurella sp. YIM 132087]|uniref:Zinc-binding dehydrogenase n=1 Tax=Nakamurella alba TaxID=2665158 RepID=A0A7K1FHV9_9ACTN|nr:zinc-binding dehydrogenase [Nakamurella alba]MTD12464.1 zinc-binding dehydrogenase [Nakamurella alba]
MRAAVLTAYGEPGVLDVRETDDPRPGPGEVLVELRAGALNWHDVLVRRGQYRSPLPHVPGSDGAGVRVDTGQEVVVLPSLHWGPRTAAPGPGWEILGDRRWGTHAERVVVPADCVAPKPAGWTWTQAAALPLVGLTTYRALFTRGRLVAGERLLVLGAGGGVATMAVLLAAAAGASVTVTSSSAAKIDQAVALGAEGGVLYTDPDWVRAARSRTPDGGGYDLVLDAVGSWADSVAALRPGGRLVVLGASRAETATLSLRPYYFGQYDLLGTTMGSPADFAGLLDMIDRHRVPPPPVSKVFDIADIVTAHEYLETGSGFGKVVLHIG